MTTLIQIYYSTLSFLGCCSTKHDVDTTPVAPFDLNRYLGKWYEIARFDHRFERGLTHVTAEYLMLDQSKVRVENSGIKDRHRTKAIGKAKMTSAQNLPHTGSLEVSFFGPFYAPYRIIMLADDYSYALVSSGKKYLWVLSRSPKLPIPTLEKILSEATRRGFDTKKLIFVNHE